MRKRMRVINLVFCSSLIIILFGCIQEEDLQGIWFHKDIGILSISDNSATLYKSHCIHPIELKIVSSNSFQITDELTDLCLRREGTDKYITVKLSRNKCDELVVSSKSNCLGEAYGKKNYRLRNLLDISSHLKFSTLSILNNKKNNLNEILLTKNDLNLFNLNELNIQQQLWLIFESGIDFNLENSYTSKRYRFKLANEKFSKSKSIAIYPVPCYLDSLFNYIESEMLVSSNKK